MKLSEAMRLGATRRPQGRFRLLFNDETCALGAAMDALGTLTLDTLLDHICAAWPWIERREVACPLCGGDQEEAWDVIGHLNDGHRWTRERIADWVATVEPQEAAAEQDARMACGGIEP